MRWPGRSVGADKALTIELRYSCVCGIHRRPVDVPAREPDTDVRDWLHHTVSPVIAADHAAESPDCPSGVMSELLLPNRKDADYIGQPRKN